MDEASGSKTVESTVANTMVSSKTMSSMAKVSLNGKMVMFTLVTTRTISVMGMVLCSGMTDPNMKENGNWVNNMGLADWTSLMAGARKDYSEKTSI